MNPPADNEAVITDIDTTQPTFPLISLWWGGKVEGRGPQDFDLASLGNVHAHGQDLLCGTERGWVILLGRCRLSVGQTIPLNPCNPA
jgi:hypothetical protein